MPNTSPAPVVCFGELLLRLTATGGHLLEELPALQPFIAGAEANVAVGLARLGHATNMVSVVPRDALGAAAVNTLRRWGVDTGGIVAAPGRMGLYFLTPGAIHRPSDILYDRTGSAFATYDFSGFDWACILAGAGWLHVSGITAALGANCVEAALAAMTAANAAGIHVSYDCNFRPKLWQAWGGDAPGLISQLVEKADLVFGGRRDIELIRGRAFGDEQAAADEAFAAFPRLQKLVGTRREQVSADHNRLSGVMFTRAGKLETAVHDVERIVDRIGGGDAFAAGVLHGLLSGTSDQKALDYGIACGCLKHAQPGDFSLATVTDLEDLLDGGGYDVRR